MKVPRLDLENFEGSKANRKRQLIETIDGLKKHTHEIYTLHDLHVPAIYAS